MATEPSSGAVGIAEIEAAALTISGLVRLTPVLPAREISDRVGAPVGLKAENLQRTGSFKPRGAINKVAGLARAELECGLVAASAGNHAQAVAVAARSRDAAAKVVMPADAPLAKVEAVRGYGAEVKFVDGGYDDAAALARELSESEGMTLIPPFDDPAVIAGQGTVGLEIAEQAPATTTVVVPIGGGGLAAGTAIAVEARLPGARVVGVVAEREGEGDDLRRDRDQAARGRSRRRCSTLTSTRSSRSPTTRSPRRWCCCWSARSWSSRAPARRRWRRCSPAGSSRGDGEVCAVLSGGNVDATRLTECIRMGETAAGRRLVFSTVVPDQSGGARAAARGGRRGRRQRARRRPHPRGRRPARARDRDPARAPDRRPRARRPGAGGGARAGVRARTSKSG